MRTTRPNNWIRVLAVAGAMVALAACGRSSTDAPAFTVERMKSPTGQAEVLLRPRGPVVGLVVFAHGYGGTQNQIATAQTLRPLRDALTTAGFAIASSDAHGNNMGLPVSVTDQVQLVHDAESRLPAVNRVDVVGFSMGGLDALLMASEHAVPHLQSFVLLSAVCNQIPFLQSELGPSIRAAFGGRTGQALLSAITPSDPERRPASSYAGYRYWFWQSPQDKTVPPVQAASMIAFLHSAGIDARFSLLNGVHGDLQKLDAASIVNFFES